MNMHTKLGSGRKIGGWHKNQFGNFLEKTLFCLCGNGCGHGFQFSSKYTIFSFVNMALITPAKNMMGGF